MGASGGGGEHNPSFQQRDLSEVRFHAVRSSVLLCVCPCCLPLHHHLLFLLLLFRHSHVRVLV
jgi:hypothetical protein